MAWTTIASGDVDAKSPLTDTLMGYIKADLDYLKSTVTDGATAPQDLVTKKVEIKGAGTALQVDNDANVDGDLTVGGTLNIAVLTFPDAGVFWMGW